MNRKANNYLWVEHWLHKYNDSSKPSKIRANKIENNKWECQITLPLVNDTISSIENSEIGAIYCACEKSAKLINQYIDRHPDLEIQNIYKKGKYEFMEPTGDGFIWAIQTKSPKLKSREKLEKLTNKFIKVIEKAILRLKAINGSDKNLFIQVIDKNCFEKDAEFNKIQTIICDNIIKNYGEYIGMASKLSGDHLINIGLIFGKGKKDGKSDI